MVSAQRWIPLESNPEVLNAWANRVGLIATDSQFCDVYGLDEELIDMVPHPVKAVVLLFPIRGGIETARREEDERLKKEGQPAIDPTVVWIKQTISNACGTMGLLHALINSDVAIVPESPLARFIDACQYKSPEERAHLLETTPLFADIHAEAASSGQTAPPADSHTDLHFTCFVQAPDAAARMSQSGISDMRIIELDGSRGGPIDRGHCTDLLKDVANYIKEKVIPKAPSLEFSMMALAAPLD
ncbi:peptidase C12 ubiquitin carboxyl-terminal hydrolase 1 [Dentipellis sp. KUC8613]|nr:peptidase C12 ubiquitin carboxyl-terminal hydrolase 1 [Dentipellis sp. KUC8613]